MQFKLEVVNGVSRVTDAVTGAVLDWVDTVDFVIAPGSTPILYLGTFAFSASVTAGKAATGVAGAAAAATAATAAATP